MILTHLVLFGFWTGAGAPIITPIPEVQQGGGGDRKKRRQTKSWDQRERERLEQERLGRESVQARLDREHKEKYGDMPPKLEKALGMSAAPVKAGALSQKMIQAQAERDAQIAAALLADDEEAMALILRLI